MSRAVTVTRRIGFGLAALVATVVVGAVALGAALYLALWIFLFLVGLTGSGEVD